MPTYHASKQSEIDPLFRWRSYLDSLIWQKGALDDSSYPAFLRAGSLGIDPSTAFAEVAQRIAAAGDSVRERKLQSQIARAYAYANAQAGKILSELRRDWIPKTPKAQFDPLQAEQFAARIDPVSFKWLKNRSPEPVAGLSPGEFLSRLYTPEERVLIFSNYRSQGECVWKSGIDLKGFVGGGPDGVWFLANPIDQTWRYIDRLKSEFNPRGKTRRAEENVTAWLYAVLECDQKPKEKWLPIWLQILVQLPLPIVSIVTSGNKSIHALVRVSCGSKADWDALVRQRILPRLVPLGADPAALTAIRLTRLPGCYRGLSFQELLYLNPQAGFSPIL